MKLRFLEPGPGLISGFKGFRLNPANATASVTSIIFGVTGAFVLFANVASGAGLSVTQAVSWIMAGNIVSCAATIFLSLHYKQPIVLMPSLSALLITGPMLMQFSMNEMVAGYLLSAVIVLLVGIFGLIGKIEQALPLPIVMAMIAGSFMGNGLKLVKGVAEQPLVGGIIVGSFLLAHFLKKIPPLLIAVIAGTICCIFLLPMQVNMATVGFGVPIFAVPSFSPRVLVSMTLPLAAIVLSGFWRANGVLRVNGYETPLNTIVRVSGLASIAGAFFMGHAVNMAGPMIAIVGGKEAGKEKHRYAASVLGAAGLLVAGVFSGFILPFVLALPAAVSDIFAGLALLGLFTSSLEIAFGSKKFLKGALTAFIVAMSGVSAVGIDAPLLALVFGVLVSLLTERECFKREPERRQA